MTKPTKIYHSADKLKNALDYSQKIVFTNGCFDIFHAGHVDALALAKENGDLLIVGINSDASVRNLKGTSRPINTLEHRMEIIAALEVVDYVVAFEEDTPLDLIKRLLPNVLVKGGDYTLDTIIGAKQVIQNGGEVKVIPFRKEISSSQIIEKIRSL